MFERFSRHSARIALGGFLAVSTLLLAACGDDADEHRDMNDSTAVDGGNQGDIRIVKGSNGPSFDGVSFELTAPQNDEVVTGDSIPISVRLTGVELKAPTEGEGGNNLAYSKDGQHIHVIVDNEPYMAKYDTTFMIGGLAPGVHTIRAFPSRSWHESVKNNGAFVARIFYVGQKSGTPPFDATKPMLTYSRPKGEYVGKDADRVLLDFYLSNAELGADAYRVVATIDGSVTDTLTEWVPYFIEGLKPGEHTVRLQLIGPDGAPVANGAWNDTERTITVKAAESGEGDSARKSSEKKDEGEELEKDIHDVGRASQGL